MENTKQGAWQKAVVLSMGKVASNVMGLTFSVSGWPGHKPGQHVDVRLTSSDGYVAERSYSIANAPNNRREVEIGVELLDKGEVSPYLFALKPGDEIEIRGPIGGHFIWDTFMPDPLILIAGGSGMVPLMSMLRHHVATEKKERDVAFIISLRSIDRLLYADELELIQKNDPKVKIAIALTDTVPVGWSGYSRRIDREMFEKELGSLKGKMPDIYVCGPTKFVEASANFLVALGFNTHSIRTERFG